MKTYKINYSTKNEVKYEKSINDVISEIEKSGFDFEKLSDCYSHFEGYYECLNILKKLSVNKRVTFGEITVELVKK